MSAQRLSQLSPARQQLVRLCQALNFGAIRSLEVRGGQPIFEPAPVVVYDWKLEGDDPARLELNAADFDLRSEVCRMLAKLDQVGNGWIERIDVRAGLPRRMLIELPTQGVRQ